MGYLVRVILSRLIVVIILSCFVSVFIENTAGADDGWRWETGAKTTVKIETNFMPSGRCQYSYQIIKTSISESNKTGCMSNTNNFQFGHYWNGTYYQNVISFEQDNFVHNLYGACPSPDMCIYLPNSDILVAKRFSQVEQKYILTLFKNFKKRIIRNLPNSPLNPISYNFQDEAPEYELRSIDGVGLLTGSIASSINERFLAYELIDHGYGIVDISNLSNKRITTNSPRYGQGSNASVEFAINDSGTKLISTGVNNGFTMYDISSSCGDNPDYTHIIQNFPPSTPCADINFNLNNIVDGFVYGYKPIFNKIGSQFSIYTWTYHNKGYYLKLAASNYQPKQMDYIAMGDSFSSGEGDLYDSFYRDYTNTENERCHTSLNAYSYKISTPSVLDRTKITNIACSGATTADILGGQDYNGQGGRLSTFNENQKIELKNSSIDYFIPGRVGQIEFIKEYQPKTATIGIGGNDIGLVGKLATCLTSPTCEYAGSADGKAKTAKEISQLFETLVNTYRKTIEESPSTKFYAIGYPKIINVKTCDPTFDKLLNPIEREYADETIKYINMVIEAASMSAGIKYIDISESLYNYSLCDNNPIAMNGFRLGEELHGILGSESFHPTPFGHQLIADSISSQIPDLITYQYCPDGRIYCPDINISTAPIAPSYWGVNDMSSVINVKTVNVARINDKKISINIPIYYLLPLSQISISLHSDPIDVGTFDVGIDGELNTSFDIPTGLNYGTHTIVMTGKSFSGEDIELHQIFQYVKPKIQNNSNTPELVLVTDNADHDSITRPEVLVENLNNIEGFSTETPVVLSDNNKSPEVSSTKIQNEIKQIEQKQDIDNISIIAVIIIITSSAIFIRYMFFDTRISKE